MTAIDFPNSPTLNQTFSASNRTWKWNGTTWETVASTTIAPTAHASSHAAAGADAVTLAQSQVTNLTTDLATKASTTDLATKASLTGAETLTNKTLTSPSLTGAVLSGAALESMTILNSAFAGYTYYAGTIGSIAFTNALSTANGTLNISWTAGTSLNAFMTTGQTLTVTYMTANGATAYYPTAIQVDGATPTTLRWANGTAPSSGNANAYDVYTFVIIKMSNANFAVLASQSKFA